MNTEVKNEVTFYTTETLTNYFTQEKEDYEFETEVNKPMYQHNIIVKIIFTDEHSSIISYDLFVPGIFVIEEIKPTLWDYLFATHIYSQRFKGEDMDAIWHCADTNETTTIREVHDQVRMCME